MPHARPVAWQTTGNRGAQNQAYDQCERCNKFFTTGTHAYDSLDELAITAPGHTVVIDPAVPATYTSTGLTQGSHCSVCETVIVAQTVIPMLTGGTTIVEPEIPQDGGDTTIDDSEVPLAGLMTRAEFVNYLYVQAGSPDAEQPTFADVAEDHEYAAAIGWAQANGIAKGVGDNEFAPDELVSVEQARLFLERYAQFQGMEMPELTALTGKEPDEILDNADEVLAEFFGEEYASAADEAA